MRFWILLLFCGGLAAILLADPRLLREGALAMLLAVALFAAIVGLFLARKDTAPSGTQPAGPAGPVPSDLAALSRSFILPGTGAFLLSVLYWYRAALGISGFEDGIGFQLAQTLLFWVPAAVFMVLYRAPGESLRPSRRSTLLLRVLTGLITGLLGMTAASQIHAWHDARYDRTTLADAMAHYRNHMLPDDVTVAWSHSRPDLDVELSWPLSADRISYRELHRIRSLANLYARLADRNDTDHVHVRMTRDGVQFAGLDWSADDRRPWDLVHINHEAAGISPRPDPDDIRHVLDGIPPTARSNRIHGRMVGDTLHLWRAGIMTPGTDQDTRPHHRQAAPYTPDGTARSNGHGRIHPELHPDSIRAIALDWRAANHLIRDIRSIFRDIPVYGIAMPGYPPGMVHHLLIPASETGGYFEAQRHLPVPDGHALIQLSDTIGVQVEDTGMRRAPVRLVWNDGRFGPSHNDITLWPWSRGAVGPALSVYLLDLDADGNVVLHFESLSDSAAEPGTVRLEPGQTIDLNSMYLSHLGWRRTGAGP
jgi:hypothetical protein